MDADELNTQIKNSFPHGIRVLEVGDGDMMYNAIPDLAEDRGDLLYIRLDASPIKDFIYEVAKVDMNDPEQWIVTNQNGDWAWRPLSAEIGEPLRQMILEG